MAVLQEGLPAGIWVRVHAAQMQLVQCAVRGPSNTPYEHGLFFFDVFLPHSYPNKPPEVHFRSYGPQLNPNYYEDGKVCLSLLGTWDGESWTKWMPEVSNLLQLFVSFQSLILVPQPFFNEAGYEDRMWGAPGSGMKSVMYNEVARINTLRSLCRQRISPPEAFEELTAQHTISIRSLLLDNLRQNVMDGRVISQTVQSLMLHKEDIVRKSEASPTYYPLLLSKAYCTALEPLIKEIEAWHSE